MGARAMPQPRPLPRCAFDGVKVFQATRVADREVLGEQVTAWLAARPRLEICDVVLTQSSDASFHCVAITIFYRGDAR